MTWWGGHCSTQSLPALNLMLHKPVCTDGLQGLHLPPLTLAADPGSSPWHEQQFTFWSSDHRFPSSVAVSWSQCGDGLYCGHLCSGLWPKHWLPAGREVVVMMGTLPFSPCELRASLCEKWRGPRGAALPGRWALAHIASMDSKLSLWPLCFAGS